MSKDFLLSIFIIIFITSADPCVSKVLDSQDTVHIHGEIKGLAYRKNSLVTFYINDYVLGRPLDYYASIDSAGRFDLKFPIRNTQNILWSYNEDSLFSLIVSPKDSLSIIIDRMGVHFFGGNAKASEDINLMWLPYRKSFPLMEEENAIAHLEPEDYLLFRIRQKDEQINFLDLFCSERNCSALFKQWYIAYCEVNYYDELLAYSWKSMKYGLGGLSKDRRDNYFFSITNINDQRKNRSDTDHLTIPKNKVENKKPSLQLIDWGNKSYTMSSEYFSLVHNLSNWSINQKTLNEIYLKDRIRFILEYSDELTTKDVNLLEDISKSYKTEQEIDSTKQNEYFAITRRYQDRIKPKMLKRSIDWEVSQVQIINNSNIRDIILCQNFSNYILTSDDADYYYNLIAARIINVDYLKAITAEYNNVKNQAAATNQLLLSELKNLEIEKVDLEKTGDQLINTILLANKNKVIFIDLWATWCGPCRADFTKMSPLKNTSPFDSVHFVYFCGKSKESDWISVIKKYDLKGTHYLLTDKQYSNLEKRFKTNGFPTYWVIDKQRKLHRGITLSNTKILTDQIGALVNEP